MRRAEQGGDDRVRDLVLENVRAPVPARVHDHLRVAEVGDGVQADFPERVARVEDHAGNQQDHQDPSLRTESYDALDHGHSPATAFSAACIEDSESTRKLAEVTTRSPSFRPETIS